MPSRPLVRAFLTFYVTLGAVVLIQSTQTVLAARSGAISGPDRPHALILGGLEMVAALSFLVPRTMRAGAAGLLAIFALAFLLHAARGDLNLALLVYAAGVVFVLAHGVRGYRWNARVA